MSQPDTPQPFGPLVARLREAAGLTQVALAGASKMPLTTLASLEKNPKQHPRLDNARKIASALGIGLRRLITAWEEGAKMPEDLSVAELEVALAYRRTDADRREWVRGALGLPPEEKRAGRLHE